ncbi:protein of unknown function DUF6 transmembrane [Desulfovibrio sp. X2]|uniref:EamA family transporter n=1 Tax=Desulfovibrio sp. X2 TaxID=941449 RepID=UPI000358CDBA|nr:EamA family transporter [Desulfovibrio sp. X2]EPR43097.1 protein of unknown function DUF6 transmembrane [Desulfovibrio sp. X2]
MIPPAVVGLFACSFCLDVSGHLCLKAGSRRAGDAPRLLRGLLPAWLRSPLVWAGLCVFVLETMVWLALLSRVPLSLAFPAASLNSCGVLLGSRLLLREQVSFRRWIGGLTVALGVALVGASAL